MSIEAPYRWPVKYQLTKFIYLFDPVIWKGIFWTHKKCLYKQKTFYGSKNQGRRWTGIKHGKNINSCWFSLPRASATWHVGHEVLWCSIVKCGEKWWSMVVSNYDMSSSWFSCFKKKARVNVLRWQIMVPNYDMSSCWFSLLLLHGLPP